MIPIPTAIEQQMLLERSVPIWPTQLRRYTETPSLVTQHCDYSVQMMQIDPARCELRGDWEECTHPLGATYHYNAKMNAFTEMNMRSCSDEELQRLERWIHASRLKINDDQWLLVVELILVRGEEVYTYYCVVPKNRTITWLQTVDAYLLFQECATASHWNHKKALALENSTAASIFWTLDQMKEMADELAIAEELAVHDGIVKESGVAICGKLLHVLRHHEYLNHHGQPEACLMRMHSLGERRRDLQNSPLMTGVGVTMFWIPIMVLKRLRSIYVDGLVNGVDIRGFTDDFSAQAKAQTTVASVIMAVDASILAIPGLGTQIATKTLCSISFVFSVYCILGCTMAQHFNHRMRSLDFAVYYLQGKMVSLVVLESIPSFLYLTSLAFAILGFLAGIFTADFGLPLSARIGCGLALIVGGGFVIPLMIASLGPGLTR
ncbi:hypothetical protein F4604DRAFT_1941882 [Suillus subluteus]|nr:hypothetical protein F4604DRAFT_1941882 [Suillus subluteus]